MKCIFCKEEASDSKSIEHIIPESLGNTKNILQKGIVCDKCNNYFAVKIELPLLELAFFKQLRARNAIKSKKGKIPPERLWFNHKLIPKTEIEIEMWRHSAGLPILSIPQPFASLMVHGKSDDFLITSLATDVPPSDSRIIARLLGKIGLEALAQKCFENNFEIAVLVNDGRLDRLRNFVRFDRTEGKWPYYVRKLYNENEQFFYASNLHEPVDVLYQYGLFFIEEEMYLCLIIKGYEFALNIGNNSIESFIKWLNINNGKSLLYSDNIL